MIRFTVVPIFALLVGVCLAVTSAGSATLMVPDRTSDDLTVHAMVFGLVAADFCDDLAGHGGHEHNCPLCHALPDPPKLTAPDLCLAFQPQELCQQTEVLRRAAQARNINHSTRAPPRIA
ncbi:hypothetical protein [Roseovarius sp. ZX-A-9]|uniref:hypothetical protein n=1 Tax=Roseovarius sp. ZX-A-9 TaxID=3014783 RepID=UPI00232DEB3A|nr:hypothetical protein [Roseovarius sp. ZX-A-9]